jgi:MFS family permease
MRRELGEGLRYVLGHRLLRPIAACTGSANFFGSIAFSILLVFCVRDLGLSPGLIGIALALGNVGWLLAAVSATRISQRFGVGRTIVGSAVLFGVAWLPVPAAPDGNAALPFLIGAVVIGGFGSVVYNITQVSLRQAIAPERIQGRMNAVMRFLVWGTLPLGSLVGGALASSIGLRETLWISAIGGALTFLPVLFSPVRSVLVIPDVSEEEGDAPPLLEAPAPAPRYGDV